MSRWDWLREEEVEEVVVDKDVDGTAANGFTSHNLMVLSMELERRVVPSGERRSEVRVSVCEARV